MSSNRAHSVNIALLALPWQLYDNASIQLGVLTAYLRESGFQIDAFHLYQEFFQYLDPEVYYCIHSSSSGEAVFAALLYPERKNAIIQALENVTNRKIDIDSVLGACNHFIQDAKNKIDWFSYDLVGFSTSHEQLMSSLVLAKEVKRTNASALVVFGGALIDRRHAEELLKEYQFIDVVCFGEGERTLFELASQIRNRKLLSLGKIPGIAWRIADSNVFSSEQRDCIQELDTLPYPDYSDLFRGTYGNSISTVPRLATEIARGCSWGKCEFCNLSIQWGGCFRRKSDERVALEIDHLVTKYRSSRVIYSDTNVSHFASAFTNLASKKLGLDAFAEVSAHLSRNDFVAIRSSGVRSIQVGIESFSNKVLKQFKKGTTVFKNLELLKWCSQLGVQVGYNIIINYPGETQEDVEENFRVMQYAKYYSPPSLIDFSLSYNSPAFLSKESHNIADWEVPDFYKNVYPKYVLEKFAPLILLWMKPISIEKRNTDWSKVYAFVDKWRGLGSNNSNQNKLTYRDSGEFLLVNEYQSRGNLGRTWRLEGISRKIYLECDSESRSVPELMKTLGVHRSAIVGVLETIHTQGILFYSQGKALSLAYMQI
jgi:ribosomal peptide maturation radical SAM protein 1